MTAAAFGAVTVGKALAAADGSDTAIALLDDEGTVVGWTQAAEQLVGYSAGEIVGRTADLVLAEFTHMPTTTGFVEQCHVRNGWSGTTEVCHRDGRLLDVCLRISMLRGEGGARRWLVSLTDAGVLHGDGLNESVRGPLIAGTPIGIVVRDLQLRCTWVNDAMGRHDGTPRDQRLGRWIRDAQPDHSADVLEALMRQVLQSGTTKVHEYRMWQPTGLGEEHPFSVSFHCLLDADGQALGVCVISSDVVENQQTSERLALLGEAGARLGSTLDVMQVSQELADLAVPLLADYVAVDLEQSVSFGEGPPVRIGAAGRRLPGLRRAGLASISHGVPESPWVRGELVLAPSVSPLTAVLSAGKSRLEPALDIAPGTWVDEVPELGHRIRENGMHSLMVVPIRARRTMLGVALFVRTKNSVPFHGADLVLAETLVRRAAHSLDNARQYARQHTAALTLQRHLLPRRLRGGMAVEVASRYLPADADHCVGGDWFDTIPLSGARVALVVGDVVGHGLHAAATMGRLRTAVHTLADMELPPDELLAHLDDTVQRLGEEECDVPDQIPAVTGATCLYAVYDPATRRCTMASAGHPPPAIIDAQGRVVYPDLAAGPPLGVGLGDPFESVELELPEGSLLALYTDGLVESRGHDIEEGMDRLGSVLAQPGRSLEELCDIAMQNLPDHALCDDVTLLLVRTRALSPSRTAFWTLQCDETAVRNARDLAAEQLAEWGLECLEDATKLIVSELVTNAVSHGTGPIGLRLIRHQALTCEVSDTDSCAPRTRLARTTDEHGRGLFLVAKLSRRWGCRSAPGGKVVWAEQDLPVHPARNRRPPDRKPSTPLSMGVGPTGAVAA
ncbi:SpoIIE family protein phosphatase [Streptomyces adustus]|uniref:protein-serine/threonine phosphatase n=1 Tax=Streptomyces adustus TaxID=1609272 RepID=A0A5N8V7S0_9ACTN|nr:SpoIIE family protein phosphatase [Streptomyces adustus]MPY31253.1 SpoIIE family protein phosphatase [Streptomyces adustus]